MAGDNAIIWRRGDDYSPRFRELTATASTHHTGYDYANIGGDWRSDPADAIGRDIELIDHATPRRSLYGSDVMAGGAESDVMFGELANDLMQGDGYIGANDNDAVQSPMRLTSATLDLILTKRFTSTSQRPVGCR